MKKRISILLCVAIILVLLICVFTACGNTQGSKQEPVYKGMTISRSAVQGGSAVAASEADDDVDFTVEQDDEILDDIQDIISIEVITDDEVKYYVNPGETFIVQVHLSNPDDFEIQSFTLNGKKYSSYMFKDGSNMELLLLEVTAPTVSGYIDLTIDAIKYIDGTEIKDVRMDGSQTIKAGVAYENDPEVSVSNEFIDTTTFSVDINMIDADHIVKMTTAKVYLTDGENHVSKQLVRGNNHIVFDNLTMGKSYKYGIVAQYDKVDGAGDIAHWLYEKSFSTLKAFAVKSAEIGQEHIDFIVGKTGSRGDITAIKLLETDGTVVQTLSDVNARRFDNMLSNHDYKLEIDFSYKISGNTVEDKTTIRFRTKAKTAPTVEVVDVDSTQTSIDFELETTDVDNVLKITKVELHKGTKLVKAAESVTDREFAGLLSNTTYTVKVTYTYDLNDGEGAHTAIATANTATLAKSAPTVEVIDVDSTQTSIDFELETTDVDSILNITKVELFKGDTLVKTAESVTDREFAELLSNNAYKVQVTYTYDLNDGEGVHTEKASAEKTTLAKTAPTVEIKSLISTQTTLRFEVEKTDIDNLLSIDNIQLFDGETIVKTLSKTATTFEIDELQSGKMYTAKIIYSYDLNDGDVVHTQTVSVNYPTLVESVAVSEMALVNNSQIKLGEELNLRIYFDNPNRINLVNIYVNGIKVQISGGDRITYAIVKFTPDEAGLVDFYVDKVEYDFNNVLVTQTVDSLAHITFPVFNDLDIKFEGVSANPYEYTGDGIYLTFDNPHNYKVYKINDGKDFMQISDNQFYYCGYGDDWEDQISSIEYGYDNYGTTTQALAYSLQRNKCSFYRAIYTAEDFLNMRNGGYYILMNDLDLRNVSITQTLHFSHLNGNGHTIRGLHNVIDTASQNYYDIFDGYSIFDTDFTEVYFSYVNSNSTVINVSLLGFNVHLYNCTVQGDVNTSGNVYFQNDGYWEGDSVVSSLILIYNDSNTFDLGVTVNNVYSLMSQIGNHLSGSANISLQDGYIYYNCGENDRVMLGRYAKEDLINFEMESDIIMVTNWSNIGNVNLKTVKLSSSLTRIGWRAFEGCSGLTSVTIPDSVTRIDGYAFCACSGLTSVTIGCGVTNIDEWAFDGCRGLEAVYITDIAMWCGISFSNYSANPLFYANNLYLNGELVTDLIIPDSVTSIIDYAFYRCSGLTSVTIPDSVTSIGGWALEGCSGLISVTIGDSVNCIGGGAFSECSGLTSVTIGNSVTSIYGGAFRGCSGLTSIIIPDSVTMIESMAFDFCYELTCVYYKGAAIDWENISIDEYCNYNLIHATHYYYSETEPNGDGNYWHYDENGEVVEW